MQTYYGRIVGWGGYVPETVITNHDLARRLETSNDWIVKRTGIHERRIAGPGETTSTMSVRAGRAALAVAGVEPNDLDMIIVGTNTPDHLTPPVSSQIQHMLGATNVPAMTVTTGCTAFVYGLTTAVQFIRTGSYRNILVIGAEVVSRFINQDDRNTAVLFGDGAGAVVVQASSEPCGIYNFELGSDGSGGEHIIAPAGGMAEPLTHDALDNGRQYVQMNGREVFKFASRVLARSSRQVLQKANMTLDDVQWILPHQANLRIIKAAARDLGLPMDRFLINLHKYANTSAASIPLMLAEGLNEGFIAPSDKLLFVSFGAGLTWATALVQCAPAKVARLDAFQNGQSTSRRLQEPVS